LLHFVATLKRSHFVSKSIGKEPHPYFQRVQKNQMICEG